MKIQQGNQYLSIRNLIKLTGIVSVVALLGMVAQGQTLLYQWNFDNATGNGNSLVVSPAYRAGGYIDGTLISTFNGGSTMSTPASSGVYGATNLNNLGLTNNPTYGTASGCLSGGVGDMSTITDFTVTMWIRPNASFVTGDFYRLFQIDTPASGDQGRLEYQFNGLTSTVQVYLGVMNGTPATIAPFTSVGGATLATFLTNSWIFLATTYNNSSKVVNMYVGTTNIPAALGGSGTAGSQLNGGWATTNVVMIGNRSKDGARGFPGAIDDVRLYAGALTLAQIQTVQGISVPPVIAIPPTPQAVFAGATANFTVSATGLVPLVYQWQKNGINLASGGNISGSQTTNLTVSNVSAADVAGYDVIVTNAGGSVTSSVVALTLAVPTAPTIYYVSPTGNDNNNGASIFTPFQTISNAQAVVRTMNASMAGDIIVYLRGGTYAVSNTITFGAADSGMNGFNVRYVAYPGETPIISGGQALTGTWTLYDANKGIYALPSVASNFRQLYVNGHKAIRARSPKAGSYYRMISANATNYTETINSSEISNWNNFTQVEMHALLEWSESILRLSSYTINGAQAAVSFQNPESSIVFPRPFPYLGLPKNHCYYFENAYEFLDAPGEWYLNTNTQTLYYMPRAGENMASVSVIAPQVETIVSIMGSLDNPAHNLIFSGITFKHSTYMRPSQAGFLDNQACQYDVAANASNQQYMGRPPAGVYVACANNVQFTRNVFTQMASTALDFNYGTHNDLIIGNVVTDISGNGISVGKFVQDTNTEMHIAYNPVDTREICSNDVIQDNYIYNIGTDHQGACGIACGYPQGIVIAHNQVFNLPYTGISVGYGWTFNANAMKSNSIVYNNVHNVVQLMADGGAIYTLSAQPNSTVAYNYLHDFSTPSTADYSDHSLYFDEGTSGYTIFSNVLVNVSVSVNFNGTASHNTYTSYNVADTNIMNNAGLEPAYVGIRNTLYGNLSGIYELANASSGLALNVSGAAATNGAPIIQSSFISTNSMLWSFVPTGNGYFQIVNQNSGKDLAVLNGSTASGATMVQWSSGSTGNDQWLPVLNSDGSYTFYNQFSSLVLDNPNSSTTPGTQMQQWSANTGANQNWRLIQVVAAPVFIPINFQIAGTNLQFSWSQGTLQQSTNLLGPWTPVVGASPPSFSMGMTPGMPQMFFRVHP